MDADGHDEPQVRTRGRGRRGAAVHAAALVREDCAIGQFRIRLTASTPTRQVANLGVRLPATRTTPSEANVSNFTIDNFTFSPDVAPLEGGASTTAAGAATSAARVEPPVAKETTTTVEPSKQGTEGRTRPPTDTGFSLRERLEPALTGADASRCRRRHWRCPVVQGEAAELEARRLHGKAGVRCGRIARRNHQRLYAGDQRPRPLGLPNRGAGLRVSHRLVLDEVSGRRPEGPHARSGSGPAAGSRRRPLPWRQHPQGVGVLEGGDFLRAAQDANAAQPARRTDHLRVADTRRRSGTERLKVEPRHEWGSSRT